MTTTSSGLPQRRHLFEPTFEKIAPGDTMKLLSTDKGHDPESIKGMLPDGSPLSARAAKPLRSSSSKKACTA
jgi:plastocyanin